MAAQAVLIAAQAVSSTASTIGSNFHVLAPLQRGAGMLINQRFPNELPPASAVTDAWRKGYIDDRLCAWACRSMGLLPPAAAEGEPAPGQPDWVGDFRDLWRGVHRLAGEVPPPGEILTLVNREEVGLAQANRWLIHQGITGDAERDAILSLRFQLPPPSDLIQFAVKEGWDAQTVARFGYDQEFPAEFQYWMQRQGYASDARTAAQVQARAPQLTWPQLYWRSHWTTISAGQAYEMLHRLRGDRIARIRDLVPGAEVFGLDDVKAVLKIHDYPAAFRDNLAALSYRLPRIRDVAKWYDFGIIDEGEVEAIARDYGYDVVDAERRRRQVVRESLERRLAGMRTSPVPDIRKAMIQGTITRLDAATALYRWAYRGHHELERFNALGPAERVAAVEGNATIQATMDAWEFQREVAWQARATKRLKRQFQRGMIDAETTRRDAFTIGHTPESVALLMEEWQYELNTGKLLASTAMIRRFVIRQILPINVARQWLINLGWRSPEIEAILAELQRDLTLENAKAQEKLAKTQAARQAAIARQIKAAQAVQREAVSRLLRTLTPAMARRYYVRGIFGLADLRRALVQHDYAGQALAAALADAELERRAYVQKAFEAKEKARKANESNQTDG